MQRQPHGVQSASLGSRWSLPVWPSGHRPGQPPPWPRTPRGWDPGTHSMCLHMILGNGLPSRVSAPVSGTGAPGSPGAPAFSRWVRCIPFTKFHGERACVQAFVLEHRAGNYRPLCPVVSSPALPSGGYSADGSESPRWVWKRKCWGLTLGVGSADGRPQSLGRAVLPWRLLCAPPWAGERWLVNGGPQRALPRKRRGWGMSVATSPPSHTGSPTLPLSLPVLFFLPITACQSWSPQLCPPEVGGDPLPLCTAQVVTLGAKGFQIGARLETTSSNFLLA